MKHLVLIHKEKPYSADIRGFGLCLYGNLSLTGLDGVLRGQGGLLMLSLSSPW